MGKLSTAYGETLNSGIPWPSHPNPYCERDLFLPLNGLWEFALTKDKVFPEFYPLRILVPFSVETSLSGVEKTVGRSQYMHYRKKVVVPDNFVGKGGLLHFGAVAETADVYVDGVKVGTHQGGFSPFSFFLPVLPAGFALNVVAKGDAGDSLIRSRLQTLQSRNVLFPPTNGIWQSVYLEVVPTDGYLNAIKVTPDYDAQLVKVHAEFAGLRNYPQASVFFNGQLLAKGAFNDDGDITLDLRYNFFPWTPDNPVLYNVVITDGSDLVRTVFGFRKIEAVTRKNKRFLLLNGQPTFLSAVLDQGYWPESGMTPPSEEAMRDDILLAKKAGFNCLRKEVKIEPPRWYYLCDKLGMLVSQDFVTFPCYSPNLMLGRPFMAFSIRDSRLPILGRPSRLSLNRLVATMVETTALLDGVTSLVIWHLFDESRGQFAGQKLIKTLRKIDKTRLIDATSVWFDTNLGDFASSREYLEIPGWKVGRGRLVSLLDFGGYYMPIPDHDAGVRTGRYHTYYTFAAYNRALLRAYQNSIEPAIKRQALSLCVYTQLTDVEDEINGFATFDRKITKIDSAALRAENAKLYALYADKYNGLA